MECTWRWCYRFSHNLIYRLICVFSCIVYAYIHIIYFKTRLKGVRSNNSDTCVAFCSRTIIVDFLQAFHIDITCAALSINANSPIPHTKKVWYRTNSRKPKCLNLIFKNANGFFFILYKFPIQFLFVKHYKFHSYVYSKI